MTCRHSASDPSCTRGRGYQEPAPSTPDASAYEVEDIKEVGEHLVMKVRYPNCAKCAYEGNKVMVFLNSTPLQVIRWKRIDPHFRDPKQACDPFKTAPSPAARFPASPEGWEDALVYARSKSKPVMR